MRPLPIRPCGARIEARSTAREALHAVNLLLYRRRLNFKEGGEKAFGLLNAFAARLFYHCDEVVGAEAHAFQELAMEVVADPIFYSMAAVPTRTSRPPASVSRFVWSLVSGSLGLKRAMNQVTEDYLLHFRRQLWSPSMRVRAAAVCVAHFAIMLANPDAFRTVLGVSFWDLFVGAAVLAARALLDATNNSPPTYVDVVRAMAGDSQAGDAPEVWYASFFAGRVLGTEYARLRHASRVYDWLDGVRAHGVLMGPPTSLLAALRVEEVGGGAEDGAADGAAGAPLAPRLRLLDVPGVEFDTASEQLRGVSVDDRDTVEALLLYQVELEDSGVTPAEISPKCPLQREMQRHSDAMKWCTAVTLEVHIEEVLSTSEEARERTDGEPDDDAPLREACCACLLAMVEAQRAMLPKVTKEAKAAFHKWECEQLAAVKAERARAKAERERRGEEAAAYAAREAEKKRSAEKVERVEAALRLSRERLAAWEAGGGVDVLKDAIHRARTALDKHVQGLPASRVALGEELAAQHTQCRDALEKQSKKGCNVQRRPRVEGEAAAPEPTSKPVPDPVDTNREPVPTEEAPSARNDAPPKAGKARKGRKSKPLPEPLPEPPPEPPPEPAKPVRLADLAEVGRSLAPESTVGGDTTCIVCFEHYKTHLALPCLHQCVCGRCASKLKDCPYCRTPVMQWVAPRVVSRVCVK